MCVCVCFEKRGVEDGCVVVCVGVWGVGVWGGGCVCGGEQGGRSEKE